MIGVPRDVRTRRTGKLEVEHHGEHLLHVVGVHPCLFLVILPPTLSSSQFLNMHSMLLLDHSDLPNLFHVSLLHMPHVSHLIHHIIPTIIPLLRSH